MRALAPPRSFVLDSVEENAKPLCGSKYFSRGGGCLKRTEKTDVGLLEYHFPRSAYHRVF